MIDSGSGRGFQGSVINELHPNTALLIIDTPSQIPKTVALYQEGWILSYSVSHHLQPKLFIKEAAKLSTINWRVIRCKAGLANYVCTEQQP